MFKHAETECCSKGLRHNVFDKFHGVGLGHVFIEHNHYPHAWCWVHGQTSAYMHGIQNEGTLHQNTTKQSE